ncbi:MULTISPECIES: winged helix-turn-helix transcriptional regulator [Chryseobacterium group]|uniref:winged helix-turn-helix transcriptional regulator n=1 Tax=Chryseobacterium group TaxID=2782232 RepID=UPI00082CEAD8|nr:MULTISPECIES: helix-turn-helix domain-containing protein [Chryseobacterium group]QIY83884.1 helix-turn-helix transcriptional regulator [Chryseobacterium sp. NEB161]
MENKRKNKDFNPLNCGVTHFLNIVGGKWKVLVIYAVSSNCNRFSLLQKTIPHISKQMLINQLRELEEDGMLNRKVFAEIPPRVEYELTEYGKTMMPVISNIQQWGEIDMKDKCLF